MSTKSKKGFTIIEVVLVLAIAGLIFLMVFIALPALQRSQRNTQRADDMSRILTAVNSYQSNNNGKTPFTKGNNNNYTVAPTFVVRYIDETCKLKQDGSETVPSIISQLAVRVVLTLWLQLAVMPSTTFSTLP